MSARARSTSAHLRKHFIHQFKMETSAFANELFTFIIVYKSLSNVYKFELNISLVFKDIVIRGALKSSKQVPCLQCVHTVCRWLLILLMVHRTGFSAVTLCTTDLKATVLYHCKDPHSSRMYHFYRLYSTNIVMFYLLISSLMPSSDAFEY